MRYQRSLTPQRGFTALELIIVLIIGFSIIGLSTSKMGEMMDSSKAALAMDSIVSLSTAIRELTPLGNLTGPQIVTQLSDSGSAPKTLKVVNGDFINQWNQPIIIAVQPPDDFSITYPAVSKVSCNKLVKGLLPYFSVSVTPHGGVAAVVARNATPTAIIAACGGTQPISLVFDSNLNPAPAAAGP